jgi:hypothetical protein
MIKLNSKNIKIVVVTMTAFCTVLYFIFPLLIDKAYPLFEDKITFRNSSAWFYFGPAIISSCDKIVIRFGLFNKPIILRPTDPAFSAVLQWIEKRYKFNLNYSTFPPSAEGSIADDSIALAKGDGAHNLLLFIPLNKLTLCAKNKDIEEEINQLKSMVASKSK